MKKFCDCKQCYLPWPCKHAYKYAREVGIEEKQIYQNFVQDELLLVNSKKMYELAGISKAIDKSV